MWDHRGKKKHRASHHFPFKDDQHVVSTGIRAKINFARGSKKKKKSRSGLVYKYPSLISLHQKNIIANQAVALLRLLALSKFRLQLLIAMPLNFQEVTSTALTL